MTAVETASDSRPFAEMREHGLLWLINRAVFHPRGYAVAFHIEDDGTVTGWSMLGDGTESWKYSESVDEDESFRAAEDFLASLRPQAALVYDHVLSDEQVEDLKRRFLDAQGDPPYVMPHGIAEEE